MENEMTDTQELWTWQNHEGTWLALGNMPNAEDELPHFDYAMDCSQKELIEYWLREYQEKGMRFVMRYWPF